MAHATGFTETPQSSALRDRAAEYDARGKRTVRRTIAAVFVFAAVVVGGAVISRSKPVPAMIGLGFAGMIGSGVVGIWRTSSNTSNASEFRWAAREAVLAETEAARREFISSKGPARQWDYGDYWKPGEPAPF